MTPPLAPGGLVGFGLASSFAVLQTWSLPEFCWSTWLAGLTYSLACVLSAVIHILLTAGNEVPSYERALPVLRRFSPGAIRLGASLAALLVGGAAFYLYSFLFSFYGIFLSVFAEMEPHELFGRNGFINSDFFTPLAYLAGRFWPMALAALVANAGDLVQEKPWKRILPFENREVLRIHVLTIALPFFSLIAWALFGSDYQPVTILLLLGIFFLLPKKGKKQKTANEQDPHPAH